MADDLPVPARRRTPRCTRRSVLAWSAKEGASTTVCAVRPDTGQETVTLDHQGQKGDGPMYAFRLTDIPVVDG